MEAKSRADDGGENSQHGQLHEGGPDRDDHVQETDQQGQGDLTIEQKPDALGAKDEEQEAVDGGNIEPSLATQGRNALGVLPQDAVDPGGTVDVRDDDTKGTEVVQQDLNISDMENTETSAEPGVHSGIGPGAANTTALVQPEGIELQIECSESDHKLQQTTVQQQDSELYVKENTESSAEPGVHVGPGAYTVTNPRTDSQHGPVLEGDPDKDDHVILKLEAGHQGQGDLAVEQQPDALGAEGEEKETGLAEKGKHALEVLPQDAVDPGGTVDIPKDNTKDTEVVQQDLNISDMENTETSAEPGVHSGTGPGAANTTALAQSEGIEVQIKCSESDHKQQQTGNTVGQVLLEKGMDEQKAGQNNTRSDDSVSVQTATDAPQTVDCKSDDWANDVISSVDKVFKESMAQQSCTTAVTRTSDGSRNVALANLTRSQSDRNCERTAERFVFQDKGSMQMPGYEQEPSVTGLESFVIIPSAQASSSNAVNYVTSTPEKCSSAPEKKDTEDHEEFHDWSSDLMNQIRDTQHRTLHQRSSMSAPVAEAVRVHTDSDDDEMENLELFKKECKKRRLKKDTVMVLIEEGYDSEEILAEMTMDDVDGLTDIKKGQKKLIQKWVKELQSPPTYSGVPEVTRSLTTEMDRPTFSYPESEVQEGARFTEPCASSTPFKITPVFKSDLMQETKAESTQEDDYSPRNADNPSLTGESELTVSIVPEEVKDEKGLSSFCLNDEKRGEKQENVRMEENANTAVIPPATESENTSSSLDLPADDVTQNTLSPQSTFDPREQDRTDKTDTFESVVTSEGQTKKKEQMVSSEEKIKKAGEKEEAKESGDKSAALKKKSEKDLGHIDYGPQTENHPAVVSPEYQDQSAQGEGGDSNSPDMSSNGEAIAASPSSAQSEEETLLNAFKEECTKASLKDTTVAALLKEDFDNTKAISAMTQNDIESLTGITKGQMRTLQKWVEELQPLAMSQSMDLGADMNRSFSGSRPVEPDPLQFDTPPSRLSQEDGDKFYAVADVSRSKLDQDNSMENTTHLEARSTCSDEQNPNEGADVTKRSGATEQNVLQGTEHMSTRHIDKLSDDLRHQLNIQNTSGSLSGQAEVSFEDTHSANGKEEDCADPRAYMYEQESLQKGATGRTYAEVVTRSPSIEDATDVSKRNYPTAQSLPPFEFNVDVIVSMKMNWDVKSTALWEYICDIMFKSKDNRNGFLVDKLETMDIKCVRNEMLSERNHVKCKLTLSVARYSICEHFQCYLRDLEDLMKNTIIDMCKGEYKTLISHVTELKVMIFEPQLLLKNCGDHFSSSISSQKSAAAKTLKDDKSVIFVLVLPSERSPIHQVKLWIQGNQGSKKQFKVPFHNSSKKLWWIQLKCSSHSRHTQMQYWFEVLTTFTRRTQAEMCGSGIALSVDCTYGVLTTENKVEALLSIYDFFLERTMSDKALTLSEMLSWCEQVDRKVRVDAIFLESDKAKVLNWVWQHHLNSSEVHCALMFIIIVMSGLADRAVKRLGIRWFQNLLQQVMLVNPQELPTWFLYFFETLDANRYFQYLDIHTYFQQVLCFYPLVPSSKWKKLDNFSPDAVAEDSIVEAAFQKATAPSVLVSDADRKCVINALIRALPTQRDHLYIEAILQLKECLDSTQLRPEALEEVHTAFLSKVHDWLKNFLNQIPPTAMLELYGKLKKHGLVIQKMQDSFLLAAYHNIGKNPDSKVVSELETLIKLLNNTESPLCLKVVVHLFDSECESFYKLAMDKLTTVDFSKIPEKGDTMVNIATSWFSSISSRQLGQPFRRQMFITLCRNLVDITKLLYDEKVELFLIKEVAEVLRDKRKVVVQAFTDMCQQSSDVQKWYKNCLKAIFNGTKVENPEDLFDCLLQSDGPLQINSRFAAGCCKYFLGLVSFPDEKATKENKITSILTNIRFWHKMVLCEGDMASYIHQHPVIVDVKNAMEYLYNGATNLDIDLEFCKKMETILEKPSKPIEMLIGLIVHILQENKNKYMGVDSSDVEANLERIFINTQDIYSQFSMIKTVIEDFVPKIRCGVAVKGLKEARKVVTDLKECLDHGKWVSLKEALRRVQTPVARYILCNPDCHILLQVKESVVYQRICCSILDKMSSPLHIEDIISEACTTGWDKYRNLFLVQDVPEAIRLEDALSWLKSVAITKEMEIASQVLKPNVDISLLEFISQYERRSQCLFCLEHILGLLRVEVSTCEEFTECRDRLLALMESSTEHHMWELKLAHKALSEVIGSVAPKEWDVILQIKSAWPMFLFIKDKKNDDFRFLIDAVVDAEQQVNPKIVRYFDRLHQFVKSIVNHYYGRNIPIFLQKLRQENDKSGNELVVMLKDCRNQFHDLKQLYNSVTNKDVITKHVVQQTVSRSTFTFHLNDKGHCSFTVSYPGTSKGKDVTHQQSQMVEYRSRAFLLQSSSDGKDVGDVEQQAQLTDRYKTFVSYITAAVDICKLCENLFSNGCFTYQTFDWKGKVKERKDSQLEGKREDLEKDFANWSSLLEQARKEYYFLNFVYADQLWTLYNFFSTGKKQNNKLKDIFKFINPQVEVNIDDTFRKHRIVCEVSEWKKVITALGKNLHSIFSEHTYSPSRPMPEPRDDLSKLPQDQETPAVVNQGNFLVVPLQKDSCYIVPTILNLYQQTTGYYPEPFQILMCTSETSEEEVGLFLRRCVNSYSVKQNDCLFCIANIELLSHEVLFSMVKTLQGIAAAEKERQLSHRLVVVCRGDPQQSLLVQFASKCRSIGVLPSPVIESFLKQLHPNVLVVKSEVPGLGKTNYIHKVAFDEGRQIQTVFISSKFEKSKFIEDMRERCLSEGDVLHLDISSVSNPAFLDDELFEFLVTGMLSSGTLLFHLPTKHVMIEVANAQLEVRNKMEFLINALSFTSCFPKKTLKWESFSDFVVSKSLRSPVQTVCHYFEAYDHGQLDTKDIAPAAPLDPVRCKNLLKKYVWKALERRGMRHSDMSFNIAQSFLFMLAVQLKRLSSSVHFQTAALKVTGNGQADLKSKLFDALTDVVADFAVRSVKSSGEFQRTSLALVADEATEGLSYDESVDNRFRGMIHWSDSNHLMILFHDQDPDTISPIYHDLNDVPAGIKDLFDNLNAPLQDFSSLSPDELLRLLKKLVYDSTLPFKEEKFAKMLEKYALTADNFQKMVLIKWKINAGIPVVIMGDTGCGKTSLIQFLADLCGIQFSIFGFHAGITEDIILKTVRNQNDKAMKQLDKQFWVLLDEINTCDYLGLLNEVLCSHTIKGSPMAPNLVFMAACNPYCLRKKKNIFTSGLEDKKVVDARSPLVYRVHPLPEGMIDYVWDFGFLSSTDERKYIEKMMTNTLKSVNLKMKTDVLCFAQKFLREEEGSRWCVSLRDVRRCQYLMNWFQNMYTTRKGTNPKEELGDIEIKSLLLAVSFCYLSRLGRREVRITFEQKLMEKVQYRDIQFSGLIRTEQLRILTCMDLQRGIAKNEALRENVFVMFVCILAKLPLFVVGKPGSSKSLSMQILRNSLRGSHSADDYLKRLPSLYIVSCQGSESLVSADISKVFDKALEYNKQNRKASTGTEDELLPVVLLDEVGLAECSPHNPLKVLHSLLEPGESEFPDVAVVGISNWALDASKMNRAIHLSRPDLDKDGLYETGKTIGEDFTSHGQPLPDEFENVIRSVAYAYFEYLGKQKDRSQSRRHFHGLRDFYSLVKYLCHPLCECRDKLMDPERIVNGILRNFGGFTSVSDRNEIMKYFMKHLKEHVPGIELYSAHPLKLIQENLSDQQSRHLLLLSSGDSALSVIQSHLTDHKFNHKVIFGSKFKDDQNSEDYHCRKLSEIILCMEQGTVLVLKDLDSVYGSLYDMLNQNYSTIGEKQVCRVARGAFSNPICEVHINFKCIVLIDVEKVDYTDPPFLNRFEKQVLNIMDLLNEKEDSLKKELTQWVSDHASVHGFGEHMNSFILNYHKELIPSLVLRDHSPRTDDASLQIKKRELLLLALPDAVMRLSKCAATKDFVDTQKTYFSLPIQCGLKGLIEDVESKGGAEVGFRLVVFTHSNVYTDIAECLGRASSSCQVEKLGAIKAEKQLEAIIRNFWVDTAKTMFFLQCRLNSDTSHLILARSLIENICQEKMKEPMKKNFCIIVHVDRNDSRVETATRCSLFNYLSGWQLYTLESLEVLECSLSELSKKSVVDVVKSKFYKLDMVIKDQLLHAFLSVRYTGVGRSPQNLSELIQRIIKCRDLSRQLENAVLRELKKRKENMVKSSMTDSNNWVVAIACDSFLIAESQTLFDALKGFITSKVKSVLIATIFNIEKLHAWICVQDSDKFLLDVWIQLFQDKDIFAIPNEQITCSPGDSFIVSGKPMDLQFPFSYVFLANLEKKIHSSFTTDIKKYVLVEENMDDANELKSHVWRELTNKYRDIFDGCLKSLRYKNTLEKYLNCFIDDICLIYTGSLPINIPKDCRFSLIRHLIRVEEIEDFHVDEPTWSQCASVSLEFLFRLWHSSALVFDTLHMLDACILACGESFIRTFLDDVRDGSPSGSSSSHRPLGASLESSMSTGTYSTTSDSTQGGFVGSGNDELLEGDIKDKHTGSDLLEFSTRQQAVEHSSDIFENKTLFTDRLVNDVCLKFMPTQQLLQQCKGMRSWQNQTGKILSVASRVGWSVPALHVLRVCNDFASLLVNIHPPSQEPLVRLAEKAIRDEAQGLESDELYDLIEDLLHGLETSTNFEGIHRFRCLFFGRCLDARDDTNMLTVILKYTLKKEFHVNFFGPVLYRCIIRFESALCDINAVINDRNYLDEHSTLQAIDSLLAQVKLSEENSPGMQFAVLCCDFMEYVVMQSDHMKLNPEDLMRISSENESLNVLLSNIAEVMYEAEICSLKFICCVAFARAFLRAVAEMLSGDSLEIEHEGAKGLIRSTSKLFYTDEDCMKERIHFTTGYILRTLYDLSDYDHLQKVCSQNLRSNIAAVESLEWPDDPGWNIIGFNPFTNLPFDKEAAEALASLVHHDHDTHDMKKYLTNFNPDKKESLLSILMVRMYLSRKKIPPTEDEKEGARLLEELMREHDLPISYRNVANCLSGNVSYKELEVTANIQELRIKVLLLHVLSTVVSHNSFLTLLANAPARGNNVFLRMFGALESQHDEVTDMFSATCNKCGCYTISREKWLECPRCHSQEDFKRAALPHVNQITGDGLDDEFVTGYFSPRAWRTTRIIINGCVFGALVADICKADQIPSIIGEDAEAMINNIKQDVNALKRIMNTGDRTVFSFLHKGVGFIKNFGVEVFHNSEAFSTFEKEITSVTERWNFQEIEMYSKSLPVLDLVMEKECMSSAYQHFMRVTPSRTFAGVVTELLGWNHQESDRHKILRLIVRKRLHIELLKFLYPLVSWTMGIEKEIGHRINRAEAAKKSVDELLEGAYQKRDEHIRLELCTKLKKFRETWKNLVKMKPIIAQMNPHLAHHMDRVDLTQKLDQYVLDSEDSALYMMIKFLVQLQNSLITEVMQMSAVSEEASNVPFMYHSSETIIVPLIPVEDVSEKDVIGSGEGQFEKVLFLTESDPRYGHGMQCSYDLDKVEFTLARDLFFGKCFLQTEGRLPLFMYEEELFFSCETLLFDIHDHIQQSEFDENIKHGLNSDLEKCPYRVRDMLMNLEIILSLLRKTGGNPKQLLVTYADLWMKSAISSFPIKLLSQTKDTIALCHISELYEFYELFYASTAIENLPRDRFCINSGEEVRKLVRDCFPKLQDLGIKQEDFVNAMKRYIVRYIRARISTLTASQLEMPLQDVLLTKRTLWPREPFHQDGFDWEKLKEVIPRELLVRHVGEIIKECEIFLKDSHEKAKLIAGWMPHANQVNGAKKKKSTRVDM